MASVRDKVDTVQASQARLAKEEHALLYLIRVLSSYFSNACASRYQSEWNIDDTDRYEVILKELMQQVELMFPHNADFCSQATELCAIREYGKWIPQRFVEGIFTYVDVMREWTDFLTEYPNEENCKSICKQFKRLSVKQRQAVYFAVPYSILFFIKRRIRNTIYGFSK